MEMMTVNGPEKLVEPSNSGDARPGAARDRRRSLQAYLVLDLVVRITIWGTAVGLTSAVFTAVDGWPAGSLIGADWGCAAAWAIRLCHWVILFNLIYVCELVVLRLLIPTPKEGRYSTADVGKLDRQLVWCCLIGILTKARYEAPFPGFFVFHVSNLPPMCWLMGPIFGPKSRSCYFTEPRVLDPSLVEIGRNVVIGFGSSISGHVQLRDAVVIKRTTIEDNVVIGGHSVIFGGVHLKAGSMIGAGAIVLPGTVVESNEFWAGIPARKVGSVCEEDTSAPA